MLNALFKPAHPSFIGAGNLKRSRPDSDLQLRCSSWPCCRKKKEKKEGLRSAALKGPARPRRRAGSRRERLRSAALKPRTRKKEQITAAALNSEAEKKEKP
eukprot:54661-Hanusia_phi.AAC.1